MQRIDGTEQRDVVAIVVGPDKVRELCWDSLDNLADEASGPKYTWSGVVDIVEADTLVVCIVEARFHATHVEIADMEGNEDRAMDCNVGLENHDLDLKAGVWRHSHRSRVHVADSARAATCVVVSGSGGELDSYGSVESDRSCFAVWTDEVESC